MGVGLEKEGVPSRPSVKGKAHPPVPTSLCSLVQSLKSGSPEGAELKGVDIIAIGGSFCGAWGLTKTGGLGLWLAGSGRGQAWGPGWAEKSCCSQHPCMEVPIRPSSFPPCPAPFSAGLADAENRMWLPVSFLLWTCWVTQAWCLYLSEPQVFTWKRGPGPSKP